MKITLEIPDESILCTVTVLTQTGRNKVSLGVFPIDSEKLKDGKTVDLKTSHDKQNK